MNRLTLYYIILAIFVFFRFWQYDSYRYDRDLDNDVRILRDENAIKVSKNKTKLNPSGDVVTIKFPILEESE